MRLDGALSALRSATASRACVAGAAAPGYVKAEASPKMAHHQNRHVRATHQIGSCRCSAITHLQPANAVFFVNLNWSFAMSSSKASVLAIGAAVLGFTIGVSGLAVADFGMSGPGSQLGMRNI